MEVNDLQSRLRSGFGKLGARLAVIFIGLGLLAIGIAWNGAASLISVVAQFPYLISGVGIGLALVITGAALLVVDGARRDRALLEAKLDVMIAALGRGSRGGGADAPADLAGLVVAGSASYHNPGCRLVDGRADVSYLTPAEARERELQPCRVCRPAASASDTVTVG